jgi:hypothetical protein
MSHFDNAECGMDIVQVAIAHIKRRPWAEAGLPLNPKEGAVITFKIYSVKCTDP